MTGGGNVSTKYVFPFIDTHENKYRLVVQCEKIKSINFFWKKFKFSSLKKIKSVLNSISMYVAILCLVCNVFVQL